MVQAQSHWRGMPPILLLDEVVAHLDPNRRDALFDAMMSLRLHVWMTGTQPECFSRILPHAQHLVVSHGAVKQPATCEAGALVCSPAE
jgi:DNA replication and repair protein RecF